MNGIAVKVQKILLSHLPIFLIRKRVDLPNENGE